MTGKLLGPAALMIFAGVVAVAVLAILAQLLKTKSRSKIEWNLYKKIDALFTPAERSFLGVLEKAVGDRFKVFGKVRLADIATVKNTRDGSAWRIARNKIERKHLDFILCDEKDLSVVCAIELNDKSHSRQDRQDRDNFVEELCKRIGLPLVAIRAQQSYSIVEIRETILGAIKE